MCKRFLFFIRRSFSKGKAEFNVGFYLSQGLDEIIVPRRVGGYDEKLLSHIHGQLFRVRIK